MLGTARLFGQTSGAALGALMFNLFGGRGTHASLGLASVFAVRRRAGQFAAHDASKSPASGREISAAHQAPEKWRYLAKKKNPTQRVGFFSGLQRAR